MKELDKFKNEMNLSGQNVYVGHRYVPKIMGDWDSTQIYEPLSIVQYQGNSFTSRQFVPSGVEITNEEFWASTGNYNAQVEQYRQDVRNLESDFNNFNDEVITARNGEETLNDRLDKDKQEVDERFEYTRNTRLLTSYFKRYENEVDDTLKLQRAIDEAINQSKNLILDEELFISDTVIIHDSLHFTGINDGVIVMTKAFVDGNVINIQGTEDKYVEKVTVERIKITGRKVAGDFGIRVRYVRDSVIRDCDIRELNNGTHGGFGIHCADSDNILIDNNTIADIKGDNGIMRGDGIVMTRCGNIKITNNTIARVGRHCIAPCVGVGSRHVVITNNFLENSHSCGIDIEFGANITIAFNMFYNNGNYQFTGETADNMQSGIAIKTDGVDNLSNNIKIIGNTFDRSNFAAIASENYAHFIHVTDNIFRDMKIGFKGYEGNAARKVSISNNRFFEISERAIDIWGEMYVITGNTFEDCLNAIHSVKLEQSIVNDNLFTNCGVALFGPMNAVSTTINGNIFRECKQVSSSLIGKGMSISNNTVISSNITNQGFTLKGEDYKQTTVIGNVSNGNLEFLFKDINSAKDELFNESLRNVIFANNGFGHK